MKKEPEYKSYESDFQLLHEILEVLRNVGMTVTATGSEAAGHIPLYEFQIETAFLQFGTLVALLNHPEKLKPDNSTINYYQNLITKKEDVIETKYTWFQVARAIETLVESEEVTKHIKGQWLSLEGKEIRLTKKGAKSLNLKKYLKKYEKERSRRILHESTLSTNRWMRIFTGVLAGAAIITLLLQIPTCRRDIIVCPEKQEQQWCCKCLKDSIYIGFDTLLVVHNTKPVDTLKIVPKSKQREKDK
jgi:hypothetical protein